MLDAAAGKRRCRAWRCWRVAPHREERVSRATRPSNTLPSFPVDVLRDAGMHPGTGIACNWRDVVYAPTRPHGKDSECACDSRKIQCAGRFIDQPRNLLLDHPYGRQTTPRSAPRCTAPRHVPINLFTHLVHLAIYSSSTWYNDGRGHLPCVEQWLAKNAQFLINLPSIWGCVSLDYDRSIKDISIDNLFFTLR